MALCGCRRVASSPAQPHTLRDGPGWRGPMPELRALVRVAREQPGRREGLRRGRVAPAHEVIRCGAERAELHHAAAGLGTYSAPFTRIFSE